MIDFRVELNRRVIKRRILQASLIDLRAYCTPLLAGLKESSWARVII